MSIFTVSNNTIWAKITPAGDLIYFDVAECRRLSAEFGAGQRDEHRMMARLCVSLLDRLAMEFDHVQLPECWTVGDKIREFNIEAQKS